MEVKSRFAQFSNYTSKSPFDTVKKYEASNKEKKMNLSIGMIKDENGELSSLKSVQQAEKAIHEAKLYKEYPPIFGLAEFTGAVQSLFFPENSEVVKEGRVLTMHTITGGASLRVAAEVIRKFLPQKIHVSNLTFGAYANIYSKLEVCNYPYYNKQEQKVDAEAFLEYLNKIDNGSNINLQLSSHNPTGLDFSKEEWDKIAAVMTNKKHLAFFDVAYLGYGNKSIEEDLYPIHKFAASKVEMLISYSSAKNFLNYSDDIGALVVVLNKKEPLLKLRSHIVVINRSLFSFVAVYGSRIIGKIVADPELKKLWLQELTQIWERISQARQSIIQEMEKQQVPINYSFLKRQKGIYMFLDLDDKQVQKLGEDYGIFLSEGGRVNISGVPPQNISYFVSSVKEVLSSA